MLRSAPVIAFSPSNKDQTISANLSQSNLFNYGEAGKWKLISVARLGVLRHPWDEAVGKFSFHLSTWCAAASDALERSTVSRCAIVQGQAERHGGRALGRLAAELAHWTPLSVCHLFNGLPEPIGQSASQSVILRSDISEGSSELPWNGTSCCAADKKRQRLTPCGGGGNSRSHRSPRAPRPLQPRRGKEELEAGREVGGWGFSWSAPRLAPPPLPGKETAGVA
ncbi:hypothetical protein DPEC_G00308850 [Dallia pectoralis]|uniref:Uncharacterized protein n=1 Tax=Dallia pectoralis TaxID=75939 RepID=A0ACC2FER4_DALPE|nr:hypothetical protein DPEC_G00308850 [Dallia pectoralis]